MLLKPSGQDERFAKRIQIPNMKIKLLKMTTLSQHQEIEKYWPRSIETKAENFLNK